MRVLGAVATNILCLQALACGGSDPKANTDPDADPNKPDAVKVDAPKAGVTQVTWALTKNGAPTTCAAVVPASPDVKVSFFEGAVSKGTKRVPCGDGNAIINIPAGTYRLSVSLAPAGDPTKPGVEYASSDVMVPTQGIMTNVNLPQVDATFTWSVAAIPMCGISGSKLTIKMDRTKVVNVDCSSAMAIAAVPSGTKAVSILVGVLGQETAYDKTLVIPASGGSVALAIP
jgi:hypothetical protein